MTFAIVRPNFIFWQYTKLLILYFDLNFDTAYATQSNLLYYIGVYVLLGRVGFACESWCVAKLFPIKVLLQRCVKCVHKDVLKQYSSFCEFRNLSWVADEHISTRTLYIYRSWINLLFLKPKGHFILICKAIRVLSSPPLLRRWWRRTWTLDVTEPQVSTLYRTKQFGTEILHGFACLHGRRIWSRTVYIAESRRISVHGLIVVSLALFLAAKKCLIFVNRRGKMWFKFARRAVSCFYLTFSIIQSSAVFHSAALRNFNNKEKSALIFLLLLFFYL